MEMPVLTEIKERLKELPPLGMHLGMAPVAKFEIRDKRLGHSWLPFRFDGVDTMYCLWVAPNGPCGFRPLKLGDLFKVSAVNDLECYQLN
jgi:hypothetical protein